MNSVIFQRLLKDNAKDPFPLYGMEVTEIGFSRFSFAPNASERIYQRMSAERVRLAQHFIDEGRTAESEIKADGARQAAVIVGQAKRKAEEIKAEAEATGPGYHRPDAGKTVRQGPL